MPTWWYMLVAYGLTFGIQNKLPFLRGKTDLTDRLLKCTYCVGFHTGWTAWLVRLVVEAPPLHEPHRVAVEILGWGLLSAAFSYGVDAAIRWLEYRPR